MTARVIQIPPNRKPSVSVERAVIIILPVIRVERYDDPPKKPKTTKRKGRR